MGRKKKGVEVKPETPATDSAADQEYPYLKTPAEQGAVIISTDERDSTRPMTEADVRQAHEDLYKTSQKLRAAAQTEKDLTAEVKRLEALLKGTREELRASEEEQLVLGRKMATFSEEIHSEVRKIKIKAVESITSGNEYVVTDARNGSVIERRTATADEIEEARAPSGKGQTGLFGSDMAADEIVLVSISTSAYTKSKRGIKDGLMAVEYPNQEGDPDGDGLGIVWEIADKRSVAKVPRWAADRLKKIADGDKALDFKIDDLAKVVEKLEKAAADGVTAEVL